MQTPTVAVEFCAKIVRLNDGTRVKAQLWDTAGQEKYKSLVSQHYRKALGALLVYDITRKETFSAVEKHLYDLRQWSEPDCVVYLIGNKVDLINTGEKERAVPLDYVKNFAEQNGLKYIETSALSDYNVSDSFLRLLEDVNSIKSNSRLKNTEIGRPITIKERQKHNVSTEKDECAC